MISKYFIINSIKKISKEFSFLKFTYFSDEMSDAHFIEISPNEYFEYFEENFVTQQNEIILSFIEKFPYESLAFIGEEDMFECEIPVFILRGKTYNINVEITWIGNEVEELLNEYEADLAAVAETFNKVSKISFQQHQKVATGFEINFKENSRKDNFQNLNTNIDKISIINQEDPVFEMDDYSLAA